LVRLICWRFYKYLTASGKASLALQDISWDDFDEVEKQIWTPYFGSYITNRSKVRERTFPYVLRHSQLRPRQIVILCNEIAKRAGDRFPEISNRILIQAVREAELQLANEVINSYSKIYRNVGDIVSAISGMPMLFKGKDLDKVARRSASSWTDGSYSLNRFRQVVTELGIVGRKRGEHDPSSGIMEADFEFALKDRLFINEDDDCVVHPMFYRKLNIKAQSGISVYPFPDHPDFDEVRHRLAKSGY